MTEEDQMSDESFGEWVHEDLSATYYIEREGWAPERAARVADRLQQGRPAAERLRTVVFFGSKETAFTVEGPYVFVSRRLLERCRTDAACAWILAHEIAHHDLGHVTRIPEWMVRYVKHRGAWVVAALAQTIAHRVLGPEREAEADQHAVDLCLRAGYHPDDFLGAFDAAEALIRDVGSEEAIYGPDCALWDELDGRSSLLGRFRVWKWERVNGYYPFRERRRRVEEYLSGLPWSELNLRREVVATESPAEKRDPWRLSSEQRGLFTSPPSVPQTMAFRPILEVRSRRWRASPAPRDQVIFLAVEDDADRMLARIAWRPGESFAVSAGAAIAAVHRRWWRGQDGDFYVVETNGSFMAVIANLPEGPWRPDITALTCLRPTNDDDQRALPWRNLGYASSEELEAMRTGNVVIVEECHVDVVRDSS
jgi:hypothetical protein